MKTNNTVVKPFCVKYEAWMTDEQVDSVLKKAVKCGAKERWVVRSLNEDSSDTFNPDFWEYFGVDEVNDTECYDRVEDFGEDAVILTLDQVDAHLGFTKPVPVSETIVQPKSLANVKLDCRKPDGSIDEELSRAFQEVCFEQGIELAGYQDKIVRDLNEYFLIVTEDQLFNNLFLFTCDDEDYFKNDSNQEIKFTYERKLVWDYEIVDEDKSAERKVVTIGGVEYYEDMIAPMLEAMQSARVSKED